MKRFVLMAALLLGGCSVEERRQLAEEAAMMAVHRFARIVRVRMERRGFSAEEAARFSTFILEDAAALADGLLDRVRED